MGVEIGVGRGSIRGIHMVMTDHIGGTGRGTGRGTGHGIGRETGVRIDESGLGATRGGEVMISCRDGRGNGAIRLIHVDGDTTLATEITITDHEMSFANVHKPCVPATGGDHMGPQAQSNRSKRCTTVRFDGLNSDLMAYTLIRRPAKGTHQGTSEQKSREGKD